MLNILLSIISGLFGSIGDYFNKKSLKFNVPDISTKFWNILITIFMILIIVGLGLIETSNINFAVITIIIYIIIIRNIGEMIDNFLSKHEKISVLIPYTYINKLLVVIFSLLIFQKTSFITSLIAVITIFIVILFSIDLKKNKKSYYIKTILIQQFLYTTELLVIGFLLTRISFTGYFVIYNILLFLIIIFLLFFKKEHKTIFSYHKVFYKNRLISTVLLSLELLIGLFLIKTIGLTLTILLSFITMVGKLSFNYFLTNEKEKKELFLAIILIILILLGFTFKDFA